jgi:hypothetical protein
MVALARLKRIFARSTNGDCERHIGVGYGGGLALNERLVRDDVAVLRVEDKIRRVVLNGQTVLDRDASRFLVGAGFSSARSSSTARR